MRASAIGLVDDEEKKTSWFATCHVILQCTDSSGSQRIGRSHCCQTGSGADANWHEIHELVCLIDFIQSSNGEQLFGCWWASCSHIEGVVSKERTAFYTFLCCLFARLVFLVAHGLTCFAVFVRHSRLVTNEMVSLQGYVSKLSFNKHAPIATEDNLNVIDVMNWSRFPEFWCETEDLNQISLAF